MKSRKKPFEVYLLVLGLVIQASSAIYGGLNLISDPTGISIRLPIAMLKGTIFPDFLIPGILLLVIIGLLPLLLIFPLLTKPKWQSFSQMNIYRNYYWAYTYTLYNIIILISWIHFQLIILDYSTVIQGFVGIFGTIMLIIILLPSVKSYYRKRSGKRLIDSIEIES